MAKARPFAYNTGAPIAGTTQVGNLAVGYPTSGSFPITNNSVYGTHSSTGILGSANVTLNFNSSVPSTFTITKNGTELVNFPASSGLNQTYQIGNQLSNILSTDVIIIKFA